MASYKEIVTKAIIGKGKKYIKNSYSLTPTDVPTTILGCWIINHKFKGYKSSEKIGVDGSFDANIWYSYDGDSKTTVVNKRIDYNELFNVKLRANADLADDTDIIVRSLRQPNCVKVDIDPQGNILFEVEKELGVEIVGETKIKIAVEEEEDPWDEIEEEVTPEIEKEIDENVKTDYI